MAAENKDIEKDIDIEEVKEDNTADEAVEEEKAAEDAKDKKEEASKEAAPKKEKKFGKKKDKAVEKLEEKVKELEDMRVRQLAEFENFRKRSEKEKSQMFEVGAKSVIEKILPVIDNFERGLAAVPEEQREDYREYLRKKKTHRLSKVLRWFINRCSQLSMRWELNL